MRTSAKSVNELCRVQCMDCGLQADVKANLRAEQVCANCSSTTWADLAEGGVVEALVEQDDAMWATRHGRRNARVKLVALIFGTLVSLLSMRNDGSVIFFPLVAMAFVAILVAAYREHAAGRRPDHPTAWSYSRAPERAGWSGQFSTHARQLAKGEVSAQLAIRAPLSGRACVAYELGVRRDSATDGAPWTWRLLEQRHVPFSVGEHTLDKGVHLQLHREAYAGELSEAAHKQLRRRGLDPARQGYSLFESVLCVGDQVQLEGHEHAQLLRALDR